MLRRRCGVVFRSEARFAPLVLNADGTRDAVKAIVSYTVCATALVFLAKVLPAPCRYHILCRDGRPAQTGATRCSGSTRLFTKC